MKLLEDVVYKLTVCIVLVDTKELSNGSGSSGIRLG